MPGRYIVLLAEPNATAEDNLYRFTVGRTIEPDTGLERADIAELANAMPVGTRETVLRGYVGSGDRTDIYAIRNASNIPGIVFALRGVSGPVSVSLLDERQTQIAKETVAAGSSTVTVRASLPAGWRGFVMVAAEAQTSTLYQLGIKAELLYDQAFAPTVGQVSRQAQPKRTYRGTLSPLTPMLHLGVTLTSPRVLRAELSGLEGNVDMELLDQRGIRIETNSIRAGTTPEFINQPLERGRYNLRVKTSERDPSLPFQLFVDFIVPDGQQLVRNVEDARRNAKNLARIIDTERFESGTISAAPLFFRVNVPTPGRLDISLRGFRAEADLDLILEDSRGAPLAKSANVGAADERIQQAVQPGDYFVRIQPTTSNSTQFALVVSGFGAPSQASYAWMGSEKEWFNDFRIMQSPDGTKCYLVTEAIEFSPAVGWLRQKPHLLVGVERGSSSIWIAMLVGNSIFGSNPIRATVRNSNGRSSTIPAVWDGEWLKPLSGSENKSIDRSHMGALRSGARLMLEGQIGNGQTGRIVYSLSGYTRAGRRINEMCRANANWILGGG